MIFGKKEQYIYSLLWRMYVAATNRTEWWNERKLKKKKKKFDQPTNVRTNDVYMDFPMVGTHSERKNACRNGQTQHTTWYYFCDSHLTEEWSGLTLTTQTSVESGLTDCRYIRDRGEAHYFCGGRARARLCMYVCVNRRSDGWCACVRRSRRQCDTVGFGCFVDEQHTHTHTWARTMHTYTGEMGDGWKRIGTPAVVYVLRSGDDCSDSGMRWCPM